MLPTTIRAPPALGDFTPLSEYQSHTPETFHGGKPVLFYHATRATASLPPGQRARLAIFPGDDGAAPAPVPSAEAVVVDIFVTSQSVTLYNQTAEAGVTIPYPAITLHAVTHEPAAAPTSTTTTNGTTPAPGPAKSVLLQLDLAPSPDADDDEDTSETTVQLTLLPPASSTDLTPPAAQGADAAAGLSEADKLFRAVSACADLNPDPIQENDDEDDGYDGYGQGFGSDDRIVFEGDVDVDAAEPALEALEGFSGVFRAAAGGGGASGALPPPLPGSSEWITAENVHEYFDEEGNWRGRGGGGHGHGHGGAAAGGEGEVEVEEEVPELGGGGGAGRVRGREEANGHDGNDAESKRARTGE